MEDGCLTGDDAYARCSPKPVWRHRRCCSLTACLGRGGAKPAGYGPRRRATLPHYRRRSRVGTAREAGCRAPAPSSGAAGGRQMYCVTTRWKRYRTRMRCWGSTRLGCSSKASRRAAWSSKTWDPPAKRPTVRSSRRITRPRSECLRHTC